MLVNIPAPWDRTMAPQPPPQPEAWEKIGKNWRGPAEKFWRYKHMYVYMYIIDKYVNIYIYNYVYIYIQDDDFVYLKNKSFFGAI